MNPICHGSFRKCTRTDIPDGIRNICSHPTCGSLNETCMSSPRLPRIHANGGGSVEYALGPDQVSPEQQAVLLKWLWKNAYNISHSCSKLIWITPLRGPVTVGNSLVYQVKVAHYLGIFCITFSSTVYNLIINAVFWEMSGECHAIILFLKPLSPDKLRSLYNFCFFVWKYFSENVVN